MENSLIETILSPAESDQKRSDHLAGAFVQPLRDLSEEQLRQADQRTSSISYILIKRLFDLLLCLVCLPILVPVMLVIGCAVYFDSPGPVFYREQRIGKGGRRFTILKFRSMYTRQYLQDAMGYDECEQMQLKRRQHGKEKGDPRITKMGRILRQTSLDELPQLINILVGDMTLVGPRPVVIAELMSYGDQQVFYKKLIPGLTGLWQVSGRSTLTFQERIQLDTRYCTEWSHRLDLHILAKTLPVVLKRHGAY